MSYLHIPNLYKAQEILLFRRCYALEKIHGTSAHLLWNEGRLGFFAGGESHERFCALFEAGLAERFMEKFGEATKVIVYGEAYGGKCQGMSATYGKELRFTPFEVTIGESWLAVPQAMEVCAALSLGFVPWNEIPAEMDYIDAERDLPSEVAARLGMGASHLREGVVLRPLIEVTMNNGARIIAKHKRVEFSERASIPEVDPSKRETIERADSIADEWVTAMRLSHVLDSIRAGREAFTGWDIKDTGDVIKAMVEDVVREAGDEIRDSKAARKAIGNKAVHMFKGYLNAQIKVP